jgi:hypothetical protein
LADKRVQANNRTIRKPKGRPASLLRNTLSLAMRWSNTG